MRATFELFAEQHPWVSEASVRPKGVAREMLEGYESFDDAVRRLGIQRSEGLLLRYLGEVLRALERSVPDASKTDALHDVLAYLRELVAPHRREPARGVGGPRRRRAQARERSAQRAAAERSRGRWITRRPSRRACAPSCRPWCARSPTATTRRRRAGCGRTPTTPGTRRASPRSWRPSWPPTSVWRSTPPRGARTRPCCAASRPSSGGCSTCCRIPRARTLGTSRARSTCAAARRRTEGALVHLFAIHP